MLTLIAIAFLLKRYGTHAVPLPVPTTTFSPFDTPIFVRDNPSDGCHSRTVLDILWSCLATTFACTWVSVHPNVPWRNEGKWSLLRRRIYLMFFSILAPEFMIVWAFKQWRGAVMIREIVNEASEKAFPDEQDPRRNSWTTTHGHLLQMGGFRLSTTSRENYYWGGSTNLGHRTDCPSSIPGDNALFAYISGIRRRYDEIQLLQGWNKLKAADGLLRTLIPDRFFFRRETPGGAWTNDYSRDIGLEDSILESVLTFDVLQQLLSENLIRFPTITEDEINDKSKGDALSKGIALLQLTWFIVQIITRATQGLAVTELELTTAALAGLNSVMYIFWWSKPRDVRFPVVIRTKAVEELLVKRTEDTTWDFSDPEEFDFREHLWTSMTTPIKDGLSALRKFLVSSPTRFKNMLSRAISVLPAHLHSILSRSYQYFTRDKGSKSEKRKRTGEKEGGYAPVDTDPETDSEAEIMSRKQQIFGALMRGADAVVYCFAFLLSLSAYVINFGLVIPIAQIMSSGYGGTFPMVFDEQELVRVFSMMFYSEDAEVEPLFITASIAGALFGGVHCLAWHFSFPSHAEQTMWRTASLGVVGACALSLVGTYTVKYVDDVFEPLVYVLLILTAVVYPVFRLMLLVLAVTSLRSLPSSAFDTVQWIEFVPHI